MSRFNPAHDNVADFPPLPVDRHPDTLAWIARIEAARLEAADPTCMACGSTATSTVTRRCWACGETKPLEAFPRHRRMPLGRDYHCRPCKYADINAGRRRKKLVVIREIVGVSA